MRGRTPRSEFNDARKAAQKARQAMLQRVGLRPSEAELEQADVVDHMAALGAAAQRIADSIPVMSRHFRELLEQINTSTIRGSLHTGGPTEFGHGYARGGVIHHDAAPSQGLLQVIAPLSQRPPYDQLIAAANRYAGVEYRRPTRGPDSSGWMPDYATSSNRGTTRALYDPVVWPDEGYPCQLCWSVGRWPWEPARACPIDVDPETTYCQAHRAGARDWKSS